MNIQQNLPPQWNDRFRWWRNGFIPGLILGILAGWFFHGVVSLIVRLGIIMIVLLPLLVIGYFWLRSSRRESSSPNQPQGNGGVRVVTWSNFPPSDPAPSSEPYAEPNTFTDVPFTPVERPQRPTQAEPQAAQQEPSPAQPKLPVDVEAELEALKRQQGQTR